MPEMTSDEMEKFFERTRQAILLTSRRDGSPDGVPVWFDWDGESVRFFSGSTAPKIARIRANPRIAMLITNDIDEPPSWVQFEGEAQIDTETDAKVLAVEVLAPRYWDLGIPDYAAVVRQWSEAPGSALTAFRLTPERIRSSGS